MKSFSEISQQILKYSGWHPNRKTDTTVWIQQLEQAGYSIFDTVVNMLAQFGGLEVTTKAFEEKIFKVNEDVEATIFKREDPLFSFYPNQSKAIHQASMFTTLDYLKAQHLQIAPIGYYRYIQPVDISLFALSDGRIFGGGTYCIGSLKCKRKQPGIYFMGDSIEEVINVSIRELIVFLGEPT